MEDSFPWILVACGSYMVFALRVPAVREFFRTRHPLGNRLERSERMSRWMLFIGVLWALQQLLQA